jgi:hypothetical protein
MIEISYISLVPPCSSHRIQFPTELEYDEWYEENENLVMVTSEIRE